MTQDVEYQKEEVLMEMLRENVEQILFNIRTKIHILLGRYYLHGNFDEIVINFDVLNGIISVELVINDGEKLETYNETVKVESEIKVIMNMVYERLIAEGYKHNSEIKHTIQIYRKVDDITNCDIAIMIKTLNDLRNKEVEKSVEDAILLIRRHEKKAYSVSVYFGRDYTIAVGVVGMDCFSERHSIKAYDCENEFMKKVINKSIYDKLIAVGYKGSCEGSRIIFWYHSS